MIASPNWLNLPYVWLNILLIVPSWTVADVISEAALPKDRRGIIRFPFGGTISRRSWACVPYLIGIVVGTLAADAITRTFLNGTNLLVARAKGFENFIYLVLSGVIYAFVFFDLEFRTYSQRKRKEKLEQSK
jgi:hypothetical protein